MSHAGKQIQRGASIARAKRIAASLTWFGALLFFAGCTTSDNSASYIPSPSGAFQVSTTVNLSKEGPTRERCLILPVHDGGGRELSRQQTRASVTHNWAVGWMKDRDVIVLFSSDVGTLADQAADFGQLSEIEATPEIIARGQQLKSEKYP